MKLFIFILISFIILYNIFYYYEPFTNNKNILTTQPLNSLQKNVKFIKQSNLHNIIKTLSRKDPITYKYDNISIIIDPLDYYKSLSNNKYKKIDTGHFFYFSKKQLNESCTFDFQCKKIGFLTKTDFYFINSIIKGYRMTKNNIKLIQLNPSVPNFDNVDFVITRIVKNSKLYDQISNLSLYVYGFNNIDIHRIRLFYPFVKTYNTNLSYFFNNTKTLKLDLKSTNIPILSMILIDDIDVNIVENFLTRLEINKNAYNERYSCFNDEFNQNMALCNSKYDINGELKTNHSLWDKKCYSDNDCPFYLKNKNYPNTRGGCIKKDKEKYGSCEMPVGINQLGYTKYDGSPFCYSNGCDTAFPDYAFPNDQKERQLHKKEIIINM
tara:strand:- start:8155 stop:9297 length:1143 start_codon:yes stop_codon:yes gene_type:complete